MLERLPGLLSFRASGKGAKAVFADEPGGHRWQRVPPSEKRGRVHTSTVTVAVLPEPSQNEIRVDERDIEVKTTRGTGPGGQARNKTESCVIVKHKPSGLTVRCDEGRSQWQNRELALALLRARLWDARLTADKDERAATRRLQVGTGMRGDKRRTIRCQDGIVTDHISGRKWRLSDYLRGSW